MTFRIIPPSFFTSKVRQAAIIAILLLFSIAIFGQNGLIVNSPDGKLTVKVFLKSGHPFYNVNLNGNTFLEDSPLGLETSIGDLSQGLRLADHSISEIRETYRMTNAKFSETTYKASVLTSKFVNGANDTLSITFNVSNNDVAFSYGIIPGNGQTNAIINSEKTGYNLPNDATVFITSQALPMTGWQKTKPSYEENYLFDQPVGTPSEYGVGFTYPALFKAKDKGWVLISETGVDSGYVGSRLDEGNTDGLYNLTFPQSGENNGMGENTVGMALPGNTPWRTITMGTSLKPIVESTIAFDVVKPKYEPTIDYAPGRAAWSWIVWQDGSINYDDQIKFIDLAAALNFEYVLIDNWWDQNIGRDRIEDLVEYARSKDVSILLWYNSNGYWNDAPQTPQDRMNTAPARNNEMEWMQKIGVKGIKVDFFGGDKQFTMGLYEDILTDANNYGLAVIFHGCTLPRGWQRMYPNFMSSEAVLASENLVFTQEASDLHPFKATILPFTRNVVGAMDFAPVFLNKKLSKDQVKGSIRRTTETFELATAILYFSPIQHFGLTPNNLDEQPDFVLDFLREVPSVWDETVFIDGEPGKYCVIARRKGEKWYVVGVNGQKNEEKLRIELPMVKNKKVKMIFDDSNRSATQRNIQIGNDGVVKIKMQPEGGMVLMSDN